MITDSLRSSSDLELIGTVLVLLCKNMALLLCISRVLEGKIKIGWGLALVNTWLAYGPDFSGQLANLLQG